MARSLLQHGRPFAILHPVHLTRYAKQTHDQNERLIYRVDSYMGAFPCKHQRHRPAISNRIGFGVEGSLSTADDQDPAALQPPAAGRVTPGLRAQLADLTYLL